MRELSDLRVGYRALLNRQTRYTLEEKTQILEEILTSSVPIESANEKINEVKNCTRELLAEYHQCQQQKLEALYLSASESTEALVELDAIAQSQLTEIDKLQSQVQQLKSKVQELEKPTSAIGTGSYALAANKISGYYYEKFGYKLDFLNWFESETGYTIIYSIRKNPGLTSHELLPNNTQELLASLCSSLPGTLPTWDFNYQNCSLTLNVTTRKPIKKELSVEDIFRECDVIRADKFGSTIQKYHIDKGGKPTLRVMSSTGGGKGIAVKNLLDYYTQNLDGWEIWLSDPQHGSEEDYWDCVKVAHTPEQAKKVFGKFVQVLKTRDNKTSTDPSVPVLGVFDEFDKKHDRDDKKSASEIWTTIRHQNLRLILIGQSSEVGRNGWQWDDMGNCCLLFISNAIDTFIKHASKDLSMPESDLTKFKGRYEKISKWISDKNSEIEEAENHYRLSCLYVNGKAQLLELPPALKSPVNSGKSFTVEKPFDSVSMSTNTQNYLFSNSIESTLQPTKIVEITCTNCGIGDVIKKGKLATGKQQYHCKSCLKKFS